MPSSASVGQGAARNKRELKINPAWRLGLGVDENGVYTYSSQKGFDILGRSARTYSGRHRSISCHRMEAKRVAAIFSEIAAKQAPIKDLEKLEYQTNGERIVFSTNAVPILHGEGSSKVTRGVDKDITSASRCRTSSYCCDECIRTFNTIQDMIMIMDRDSDYPGT